VKKIVPLAVPGLADWNLHFYTLTFTQLLYKYMEHVGYGVTANIAASHKLHLHKSVDRGSSGFDSPYPNFFVNSTLSHATLFANRLDEYRNIKFFSLQFFFLKIIIM
jgi:hypothetical protein